MRHKPSLHDILLAMGDVDAAGLPAGDSGLVYSRYANSVNDLVLTGLPFSRGACPPDIQAFLVRLSSFKARDLGAAGDIAALRMGVAIYLQFISSLKHSAHPDPNTGFQDPSPPIKSTKDLNAKRKRARTSMAEILAALNALPSGDRLLLGLVRRPTAMHSSSAGGDSVAEKFGDKSISQNIEYLEYFSELVNKYCVVEKGVSGKPYSPNELGVKIEILSCFWFGLTGGMPDLRTKRASFGHFIDEFLPDLYRAAPQEERKPAIRALLQHIKRYPRYFVPPDILPS